MVGMGNLFRRVLSVVLGVAVLLPPGWCCYVDGGTCCHKSTANGGESTSAPCRDCCRDCCCPAEETSSCCADEAPISLPVKSCCCQQFTADRPAPGRGPVVVAATTLPLAVPLMMVALRDPIREALEWVAFSPHLHVVHCVWLC
jgi:hypothetical protein